MLWIKFEVRVQIYSRILNHAHMIFSSMVWKYELEDFFNNWSRIRIQNKLQKKTKLILVDSTKKKKATCKADAMREQTLWRKKSTFDEWSTQRIGKAPQKYYIKPMNQRPEGSVVVSNARGSQRSVN